MNLPKQLIALIFLGAITVVMLHDGLPHKHHPHKNVDVIAISSEDHHHSHSHGHDHSGKQDSEEKEPNFSFSFILDHHSHADHNSEYGQYLKGDNNFSVNKVLPKVSILASYSLSPKSEEFERDKYFLFLESYSANSFLLNYSLRAPPCLG